jgi:glycosyltransferase involved in cell wall biosynthesis
MEKVSIYVKNKTYGPAPYYCITQYVSKINNFNGRIFNLWPDFLYEISMKPFYRRGIGNIVRKLMLLLVLHIRAIFSFINDIYFSKPYIVIICREIFPKYMPIIYKRIYYKLLKNKKVIWLFDDNIKNSEISKREWKILCENSTSIMVTHDYLASTLPQYCKKKVNYIPQADGDISREIVGKYKPYRKLEYGKNVNLVWVATASSLPNLLYIIKSLDATANLLKEKYNKNLVLNSICNIPLDYNSKDLIINNVIWNREIAIEYIAKSHIGIMPLIDNDYNRGKGGFKLVQYLTAELPVIASNVGWNKNVVGASAGFVLDDSEDTTCWINAIEKLSTDYEFWQLTSNAAKEQSENKFSFRKNTNIWKNILNIKIL